MSIILRGLEMSRRDNNKTELERVTEFLIKEGFHEVTEEEKKEEWFKIGISSISCETESEEEFEKLCK